MSEELHKVIEELEEIYWFALEENKNGDPDQRDYFQGKKDGVRTSLALLYDLVGNKGEASFYRSQNATTHFKRPTVVGWLQTLIDLGGDLVESIDTWAEDEEISKWHPVLLERNALRGRLNGASVYLKKVKGTEE